MLALLLLVLPFPQHPVRGLRAGETVQPLPPAASADEDEFVSLRFLDATSSQPLEGVRVEAWTEPGAKPLQLETRVDDVRSALDGSARVHWRKGEVHGEKLRISKPGYESQQCGPDPGEMLLVPAEALRGRVLDLALRPIAGATVRSRQSCAHAISASETRTGPDGGFVLEDFPISGSPELEVFADGFSGRGELDPLVLREQAADARARGEYGCTILLASCAPWRLRLLDSEGKPLAKRCVRTTERPVIAQWTDADGMCAFTLPVGASNLYLETCDDGRAASYSIPMTPRNGVTQVRPLEPHIDRPTTSVRLSVGALAVSAEARLEAGIFCEEGFVLTGRDSVEFLVPRGKARVVVSGEYQEYLCEYAIEVGEQPIVLDVRAPDPWPSIALPMSEIQDQAQVLAQLGSRTEFAEPVPPGATDCWLYRASPGSTPGFALHERGGAVRIAHLVADPAHVADLAARFREPGCEVAPALRAAAPISVPWQGKGAGGFCPATAGTVWPALLPCPELEGAQPLELPEGRLYYAEFSAEGAVPRHCLRRASADEGQRVDLVRRARLAIEGDVAAVEQPLVLEPAPGPLFVRVEHRDGTASLLALVLAPGEQRTLVVE